MSTRVLLADRDEDFLGRMRSVLCKLPSVQVVGCAADGIEVVRKAAVLRPDVVVLELALHHGGGILATRRILDERPQQVICVLTSSEQESDLFAAIRAGARGYLLKANAPSNLCRALQILASGGAIVTPHLATRLLDEFARLPAAKPAHAASLSKLTPREQAVLGLVVRGAENPLIGALLGIEESTVKVHLRNILDKLHLRNRQHLAAFAVQTQLLPPEYASRAAFLPRHADTGGCATRAPATTRA